MIDYEMSEADYHARTEDSASMIELFLRDRGAYRDARAGKRRDRPTEEMIGGRYLHAGVLTPHELDRFVLAPSRLDVGQAGPDDPDALKRADGRKKNGKDAVRDAKAAAKARGATMVDPLYGVALPAILRALAEHPEAGPLLFPVDAGRNEASMFWTDEETGRPMRARLDRVLHGRVDRSGEWSPAVPDLKTTEHGLPIRQTLATWHRYGYHRKAAVYIDGLKAITGKWYAMPLIGVTVHHERPRVFVRWLRPDDPATMIGRSEYRAALRAIGECERTGEWREPFELEVDAPFELPAWAVQQAIGNLDMSEVGEA